MRSWFSSSEISIMALAPEISRLKVFFSPAYCMVKSLTVFKGFVIQCVRSLSLDEREAFRHWCLGVIPESKLDGNLNNDGEMFKLIEFLCNDFKLSFNDLSLLAKFLSSVGRCDLLEALERVELIISVGSIVEDYIKSVNGCRQGGHMTLASRYTNIVEFLAVTRERNQELISSMMEVLRQVNDLNKTLEVLDNVILDSKLSWSTVISSLVIVGELYASFSPVDVTGQGYYVCLLSETKASKFLTVWMLENGGLVSKHASSHFCDLKCQRFFCSLSNATNATICINAITPRKRTVIAQVIRQIPDTIILRITQRFLV